MTASIKRHITLNVYQLEVLIDLVENRIRTRPDASLSTQVEINKLLECLRMSAYYSTPKKKIKKAT